MPISSAVEIELSEDERSQLESWARRRSSAQALAQRSRIVLLAAEGLTNTEIAQRLGTHRSVVTRWRNRFGEDRLEGLLDEPRPGHPRKITDAQVEEVIVKTLESTPHDRSKVTKRFKAECAAAGVHPVRFHDLRHTFGTRMAASGQPIRSIQEFLGHADVKTTQIYMHYAPSEREIAMVNEAFAPAGNKTGNKLSVTPSDSEAGIPADMGGSD